VAVVQHNALRSALHAFEFRFDTSFIAGHVLVLYTMNAGLNVM